MLLILAGVTISLVVGQNGIITRAKQAQEAQEIAEERERIQMEIVDLETDSLQRGKTLTIGEITTRIVDEKKLATNVNRTTGEIITAKGHSITDLLDEFIGSGEGGNTPSDSIGKVEVNTPATENGTINGEKDASKI